MLEEHTCAAKGSVTDKEVVSEGEIAVVVGSSAKGSNLMKGGGALERIEDERRRPPAHIGPTKVDETGEPRPGEILFLVTIASVEPG